MTLFDWFIIIIFLISMWIGFVRGFIREALSIVTWVFAIWLGLSLAPGAADFISQYVVIASPAFRIAAGFCLVFVVTLFTLTIISAVIVKFTRRPTIRGTDMVLGMLFGAVRAIVVGVFTLMAVDSIGMQDMEWRAKSFTAPYFAPIIPLVQNILPGQAYPDGQE